MKPATSNIHILTLLCSMFLPFGVLANANTLYTVGNSLTWDAQPNLFDSRAAQLGEIHTGGYHIQCGQSLTQIIDQPSPCVSPNFFGTLDEALPNHSWDAVMVQPFPNGGATILSETNAFLDIIDLTRTEPDNLDTVFNLYTGWPERDSLLTAWDAPQLDLDDTPAERNRDIMNHILGRVKAQTDAEVSLIPVGEVLYRLASEITEGNVPGVTSINELYRDSLHLDRGLGRYIASATVLSTFYATPPDALIPTEIRTQDATGIEPPSPFGDLNGDGFVGQADLDVALLNWGSEFEPVTWDEEIFFDGLMSQNELDLVLLNWGSGVHPGPPYSFETYQYIDALIWSEVEQLLTSATISTPVIPEPSISVCVLFMVMLGLIFRERVPIHKPTFRR